jgi:branched-chain amino acid transport system permease protein
VVNFAQGAMVLFAALTFVGQLELGVPVWLAFLTTIAVSCAPAIICLWSFPIFLL